MPLQRGRSRPAFEANLKTELAAGKKPKQALAIAYAEQRRSGGKPAKRTKSLPKEHSK